jgi:hypothetical protein
MFDTQCGYCGKPMKTYAKNKRWELPVVYCSKACEANSKYDKRHSK